MRKHQIFMEGQDITDIVVESALNFGINKEFIDRLSTMILIQIYIAYNSRTDNVFHITNEILKLEGLSPRGRSHTKKATMFNRKPYLRGLWHKHYLGSNIADMAINLKAALNNYGLPKLNEKINELSSKGILKDFLPEDAGRIAHEVVIDNYFKRSQDSKLTGHWIIYAVHEGKNHYLTLARHTDDEAKIREKIEEICAIEFPFLKEILHPINAVKTDPSKLEK